MSSSPTPRHRSRSLRLSGSRSPCSTSLVQPPKMKEIKYSSARWRSVPLGRKRRTTVSLIGPRPPSTTAMAILYATSLRRYVIHRTSRLFWMFSKEQFGTSTNCAVVRHVRVFPRARRLQSKLLRRNGYMHCFGTLVYPRLMNLVSGLIITHIAGHGVLDLLHRLCVRSRSVTPFSWAQNQCNLAHTVYPTSTSRDDC